MLSYEERVLKELKVWNKKMIRRPSITSKITKGLQDKTNSLLPDKFHKVMTETIKAIVKAVLIGSEFTTREPLINASLFYREKLVLEKFDFYKKAAIAEGIGTGAGGFLLGLADFPILLSLKFKFLFDVASIYGYDIKNYKERLYILYVFQLAFSSQGRVNEIYNHVLNWEEYSSTLPEDMQYFDWKTFQQEYRDYIDLAKLLQMVPGIGAAVGGYANNKLMIKLNDTAMNAYRLRFFKMEIINTP